MLAILVLMLGSATKLKTARNIALTGAVTGNANFDGTGNISINTTQEVKKFTTNFSATYGTTGSATFRKSGNIVNIFAQINIPANTMDSLIFNIPNFPDWAKTNQASPNTITTGIAIGGLAGMEADPGYTLQNVCRLTFHKHSDTVYRFVGLFGNKDQDDSSTLYISMNYIVE